MGTEYYLCDRIRKEVLYCGKSYRIMDAEFPDPSNSEVSLISAESLRLVDAGEEDSLIRRAARWCEGRNRVEIMIDTSLWGAFAPWQEARPYVRNQSYSKPALRKDWSFWTADRYHFLGGIFRWYFEEDGWKPFRLEGE